MRWGADGSPSRPFTLDHLANHAPRLHQGLF